MFGDTSAGRVAPATTSASLGAAHSINVFKPTSPAPAARVGGANEAPAPAGSKFGFIKSFAQHFQDEGTEKPSSPVDEADKIDSADPFLDDV